MFNTEAVAPASPAASSGRLGTPDDVASLCMLLLSREAADLDAATVYSTGGVPAGPI